LTGQPTGWVRQQQTFRPQGAAMPTPTVVGLEDDQDILQNERVIDMDKTLSM
jgi:hypothetical protein